MGVARRPGAGAGVGGAAGLGAAPAGLPGVSGWRGRSRWDLLQPLPSHPSPEAEGGAGGKGQHAAPCCRCCLQGTALMLPPPVCGCCVLTAADKSVPVLQVHAELVMDVPVEHGLLLENLLDLAHAPFTHTSTFAKGWPIPGERQYAVAVQGRADSLYSAGGGPVAEELCLGMLWYARAAEFRAAAGACLVGLQAHAHLVLSEPLHDLPQALALPL